VPGNETPMPDVAAAIRFHLLTLSQLETPNSWAHFASAEIVLSASQTVENAVSDLRGEVEDFLKKVAV
jgi:hypothetical protein